MSYGHPIRGRGGIGRRARFRSVWETMGVRIPSTAPKQKDIHVDVFLFSYEDRRGPKATEMYKNIPNGDFGAGCV